MSEKATSTITIKSIDKDGKDGKHYYDFEMGKKFFRWKIVTTGDKLVYVRKLEENGPVPYKVGEHLKGVLEDKEKDGKTKTVMSKVEVVNEHGAPVAGSNGKSTYNDPSVSVPKMRAKAMGAAIRVILKLKEWDSLSGDSHFKTDLADSRQIISMQSTFMTFLTEDEKDTVRDNMDLRLDCLHMAISCMDLPAFTALKDNDSESDTATQKSIIKKKLTVKLVEQADSFYAHVK